MSELNRKPWHFVVSIAFAFCTLSAIVTTSLRFIFWGRLDLLGLLSAFSLLFLTVVLFLNRKGTIFCIASGIYALLNLIITLQDFSLSKIVGFFASALITALAFLMMSGDTARETAKKIWLLPTAFSAISCVIILFIEIASSNNIFLSPAYTLLLGAWLVFSDSETVYDSSSENPTTTDNNASNVYTGNAVEKGVGYCNLILHTILLFVTFGIWNLIWIYRVTDYTNRAKNEERRDPATKLLLCMFIPFYIIYWTYVTSVRIDKMAAAEGASSDLATICPIFAIFIPFLPMILMQSTINKIAHRNGNSSINYSTHEL